MSVLPSKSVLLTTVLTLACFVQLAQSYGCMQNVNCFLPDCFCPTFRHPFGRRNIPQIVYFGFDDAVQSTVSGYYEKLFTKHRKNPNGCRITMSLYASDQYTDYQRAHEFYSLGDELGVHSVSHKSVETPAQLYMEAKQQKQNLEYYAGVPAKKIVGWRSPNLMTVGDSQPEILQQLNYTYDISLSYFRDLNTPFPFTLDYGYPYPCAIPPCPSPYTAHKGFWEVMIKSFFNPETGNPCGYVDGCRPKGEERALEYLWWNFLQNYDNEKAPFGLNMHAAWFGFPAYMRAMERFIDMLLEKEDVYIVSVSQMLEWVRNPVTLDQMKFYMPFGCAGMNTTTSSTTSTTTTTTTTTTPTTTTTTTTRPTTTTTEWKPETTTTQKVNTTTTSTPSTPTTPTTTTDWPPVYKLLDLVRTEDIKPSLYDDGFLRYWFNRFRGYKTKTADHQTNEPKPSSATRAITAPKNGQ